jgi:hypothetical protein
MELRYFFGRILAAGSVLVFPQFALGIVASLVCAGRRFQPRYRSQKPIERSKRKYLRARPRESSQRDK